MLCQVNQASAFPHGSQLCVPWSSMLAQEAVDECEFMAPRKAYQALRQEPKLALLVPNSPNNVSIVGDHVVGETTIAARI